jgi:NADH:ubiquinone oxidoreductase subunit 2 (subunit N)
VPAGCVYRVALQNESDLRFHSTERKEITGCYALSVYGYIYMSSSENNFVVYIGWVLSFRLVL